MEIDKQFLDSLQLCYRAYKHLDLYKCNESQVNVLNAKIGIEDIELDEDFSTDEELYFAQLYVIFFELNYLHFTLKKIIKCLDLSQYEKALTKTQELEADIQLLFSFLSSIELYISNNYVQFNSFITPLPINFFKTLKRSIILLRANKFPEYQDAFIRLDVSLLTSKLNVIKFLYPLYFMIVLSTYNTEYKNYSKRLLFEMNKILGSSGLQYIQLQQMRFDKNKPIDLRGVSAGTTRVLGIFTRDNDDIYLFRIDFPHHKEESIHINLHETTKNNTDLTDAYYPISYEEKKNSLIVSSILDEITFDTQDGYYWFKSKAKSIVSEFSGVLQNDKDDAIEYLNSRHHFEIENTSEEDSYMNFINHYTNFFNYLNMPFIKLEPFGRQNKENAALIKKFRDEIKERMVIYAMYYIKCGIPDTEIIDELQIDSNLLELIKSEI